MSSFFTIDTEMKENWEKIVPKLIEFHTATDSAKEQDVIALLVIDKGLRPSGTAAKAPAMFLFYEVKSYSECYIYGQVTCIDHNAL